MSVKELRSRTAEHMRSHADDFLPFLTNPNTGDMYTTGNTIAVNTGIWKEGKFPGQPRLSLSVTLKS